jgi:hypothetical protein
MKHGEGVTEHTELVSFRCPPVTAQAQPPYRFRFSPLDGVIECDYNRESVEALRHVSSEMNGSGEIHGWSESLDCACTLHVLSRLQLYVLLVVCIWTVVPMNCALSVFRKHPQDYHYVNSSP